MQYHHGNLKQNLIDCAYQWISTHGIDGISLRSIAKISNVSQTAPYRHFDSKEHLLAEVAVLGFENFSKEMGKHEASKSPTTDLVKCGVSYIEFGLSNEHIIDLMFNYPIKKTDFPNLLAAAEHSFGMLLGTFKRLHQQNIDATQLNSVALHAYVHGLLSIILINERIDKSATNTFYKASSHIKGNLEKMLTNFIENLDFS